MLWMFCLFCLFCFGIEKNPVLHAACDPMGLSGLRHATMHYLTCDGRRNCAQGNWEI